MTALVRHDRSLDVERLSMSMQASIVCARKMPRDMNKAREQLLRECATPAFADDAIYALPQGKTIVKDVSVRVAEVVANAAQNIDYYCEDIERGDGWTRVQITVRDLENNNGVVRSTFIDHVRAVGKGEEKRLDKLIDPYEVRRCVANMAAREMRAYLLKIVPRSLVEFTREKCMETLANASAALPIGERVTNMLAAFKRIGVSKEMIEDKFGVRAEALSHAQLDDLSLIRKSIKNKDFDISDFFESYRESSNASADVMLKLEQGDTVEVNS